MPLYEILFRKEYRRGLNVLRDLSQVTSKPADPLYGDDKGTFEFRRARILESDLSHGPARRALLVQTEDEKYVAQEFAYSLEESPIVRAVFTDISDATLWLGLPRDYVIEYPAAEDISNLETR